LGIDPDTIRGGIKNFTGVKRRFSEVGEWNGAKIFDDYGHHPVEISAVLRAARASTRAKVIAVVQPHRYTRLHALFEQFATCFNDADCVIVSDIYTAGEAPIQGADRDTLVASIKAHGHRNVMALDDPSSLAPLIKTLAEPGDYVVCLGAGSITQWANALPQQLSAL
jgi:UDP-N-acetylmuramate--alanine ligase